MQYTKGLTAAQVQKRIESGDTNKSSKIKSRSALDIFKDNIFTYFNFLNFLVFVLILFTGEYKNALFMGVVITNAAIGIYNEFALKRKLDKISFLKTKKANVIRDGQKQQIASDDIVQDDIISYKAGDEILCDCCVVQTDFLEVNESLLTGESCAVMKNPGDEITGASFVVAGQCLAKATKVGDRDRKSVV